MIDILFWIIIISAFTLFGSLYVRKYNRPDALESVLGQVPRIALASWIAFLISENLEAFIYGWFKDKTRGKHLWARNAFSSVPAMALDSVLFITIAFYSIMPVVPLIFGQLILKWLVAIIDIPFMYLNRWVMYRGEH
jgi:queuosine precursor transporter